MSSPVSPGSAQTPDEERIEKAALGHTPPPGGGSAWLIGGVLAVLAAGVAIAWALHSRTSAEGRLKEATLASSTRTVAVVHPQATGKIEEITLPGIAQAFQDTAIYARTSGYLKSWKVDIGSRVKEGEVLAEIETPEVDRQLEQTRADLKNAEANLELAQITASRTQNLLKTHTISEQERDQAASDLTAKQALVASGQANVRRLEQLQSFEKIFAPFGGVITARNTDIGTLIQAGGPTGSKELFHLADNHILRVYFSVPEIYASTVKAGEALPTTFDAFAGETFPGQIVRDSAAIDPRSHTLMVEADVENPDGRLLPGGYATVHLKLPGIGGALTVPANTLLFREEGPRVALVRDGHVALVPVTIGRDHGNTLEVVAKLTPEDSLVLDPADSLAEGEAVTVETPPAVK